jgi:tRNA(Ile)-lysidine synthase
MTAGVRRAPEVLVIGHVVHDLRAEEDALADRDAAAALAARLGLEFIERRVQVRGRGGNPEAAARKARYAALAEMAAQTSCGFVASAHHADDQLETLLMAVMRGAGPGGMAGAAEARPLPAGIALMRPALTVRRSDLQRLCRDAGWAWREDQTNTDTDRLRAGLRHGVLPRLRELRPGVEVRAARTARLLAGARDVVDTAAAALMASASAVPNGVSFPRELLRSQPEVVLGTVFKKVGVRLRDGAGGDRVGRGQLDPVIRAVRARDTRARRFAWRGLDVRITARDVSIRRSP